jgi:DNA-binding response OmpR family regulator
MASKIVTRVLIIDDEEMGAMALQRVLEVVPERKVSIALDGESGLIAARTEPPDLIMLDILMPKMDGWEVLRELKEDKRTHDIPVIVLTAVDDEAAIKEALYEYNASYITKPADARALEAAVQYALQSRD